MKIWNFIKNNIYIRNLLLAIFVVVVIINLTFWWLDVYTRHGKAVEVPDVKGLQVQDAAPFFERKSLRYAVIDSVFRRDAIPGSILETLPPIGTKVKEGRIVYVTINSFTAQMLTLPEVKDMSQRQAYAMLQSMGFESVQVRSVPGSYRDLVLGIESLGKEMESGQRVPTNTPLTILVSSGTGGVEISTDSVVVDSTTLEESWF